VVQVLGAAGFLYWDWRQHREDPDDAADDESTGDGDTARDKSGSESDGETDESDESEVTASADSGD
jgi:hypothetical protein